MTRIALTIVMALATAPALAEPLVFEGRVEAAKRTLLSTRLDGVVAEILFEGGERIEAGQPLIRLDPADAELALAAAEARLAEARALLTGAERRAARQEQLAERGVAADAQVGPARTARAAAEAAVARAEVERGRAALDLTRAVIRAPIAGYVSRPAVAVGAFIEAEAGPPLAEIVALDKVVLAYRAPYADRLAALEATGAETVADLLAGVRVTLRLPSGQLYQSVATPHGASAEVDAETGAVTVWARFPKHRCGASPGHDGGGSLRHRSGGDDAMSDLGLRRGMRGSEPRYAATIEGVEGEAEATYPIASPTLLITDPDRMRGHGVAGVLAERLVADGRAAGFEIVPLCPFINAEPRKHSEWTVVLA